MRTTKLNDPGEQHDGMEVVLCTATDGDRVIYTCVRADNEPPRGVFYRDWSPLLDIDYREGSAWRWRSSPSIGEITSEQRLRLLLGETVTVKQWTIKPV